MPWNLLVLISLVYIYIYIYICVCVCVCTVNIYRDKKKKTLIIIKKCFFSSNQNIRMSSEGSCDTEDWSNDAENSDLYHRNKLHLQYVGIETIILNCNNISKYYCYYCTY